VAAAQIPMKRELKGMAVIRKIKRLKSEASFRQKSYGPLRSPSHGFSAHTHRDLDFRFKPDKYIYNIIKELSR